MITGIKTSTDQSFRLSQISRSENFNLNTENILITDQNIFIQSGLEDTEFEITNENSEGFNRLIETPKSSNLMNHNFNYVNTRNSNNTQNTLNTLMNQNSSNPQIRDLGEKLQRREKENKRINEKIQKLVSDLHKMDEENKRYERRIEKEEAEGEMLRHMLNFLMSNA